jgi:hypothetical protein
MRCEGRCESATTGVVEHSGLCGEYAVERTVIPTHRFLETTPGVYQASGYDDLTATQCIWRDCPMSQLNFVITFDRHIDALV